MTPLDAINQHRYTYFGFKDVSTADHPYQYLPALCYSDNLTNWDVVQYYPELGDCGAQSVAKIGDWYYVIATGYLMRTKNFVEFERFLLCATEMGDKSARRCKILEMHGKSSADDLFADGTKNFVSGNGRRGQDCVNHSRTRKFMFCVA